MPLFGTSQFFRALSHAFRTKLPQEIAILKKHASSLVLLLAVYYAQGIATNILRYYTVTRPPLWDFGFQNIAPILPNTPILSNNDLDPSLSFLSHPAFSNYTTTILYISSIFARFCLFLITLFSLSRFYISTKKALWSVMLTKIILIIVAISFVRICTIFSTQLPPSAPHCQNTFDPRFQPITSSDHTSTTGSNSNNNNNNNPFHPQLTMTLSNFVSAIMPWNQPAIFSLFPRFVCGGDGSFSLHTIGFILCSFLVFKFESSGTIQLITAILSTINVILLLMMKINYSLDVWVSFFTTFLMFLYFDARARDIFGHILPLQPPHMDELANIKQFSRKQKDFKGKGGEKVNTKGRFVGKNTLPIGQTPTIFEGEMDF
jgi:hypothetical protein